MKTALALCLAGLLAASACGAANAITVDGVLDAGYGPATSSVGYDASATGDFSSPGNTSNAIGYNIFLKDAGGTLYGYLQGLSPPGASAGSFANLYFGCSCAPGQGSVYGFEITNQRAFIPGVPGYVATPSVSFVAVGDNIEFSIPNTLFEMSGTFGVLAAPGDTLTLRLSQSFGYTVAGGASYGPDRLGSVTLSAGVPEASTWAMLILGFAGLAGVGYRRARMSSSTL